MKTMIIEFDDAFDIDALLKFLEDCKCSVKADVQTIHIPIISICSNSEMAQQDTPLPQVEPEIAQPPKEEIGGICEILDLSVSLPFCVSSETEVNKILVSELVTTEHLTRFKIGEMAYAMQTPMQTIRVSIKINDSILSCEFMPELCDCEPCIIFSATYFNQVGDDSEVPAQ